MLCTNWFRLFEANVCYFIWLFHQALVEKVQKLQELSSKKENFLQVWKYCSLSLLFFAVVVNNVDVDGVDFVLVLVEVEVPVDVFMVFFYRCCDVDIVVLLYVVGGVFLIHVDVGVDGTLLVDVDVVVVFIVFFLSLRYGYCS